MDKLEKRILKELQLDARSSFTKIAQKIGVSTTTVSERVKRLTKKGIICGYTAVLNTSELDMVTLDDRVRGNCGLQELLSMGERLTADCKTGGDPSDTIADAA